jgi:hypothetical protein
MAGDFIPFENLVVGRVYELHARNLRIGVWTGENFIGIREKFHSRFLDASEIPGRTAWALREVGEVPEWIPRRVSLGTVCADCHKRVEWTGPPSPAPWRHVNPEDEVNCDEARATSVPNRELFDALEAFERVVK